MTYDPGIDGPPGASQGLGAIPTSVQGVIRTLRGKRGSSATLDYNFTYVANFTSIPQNTEASVTIQTDAGSDFVIKAVGFYPFLSAATTPTGYVANAGLVPTPSQATAAEAALIGQYVHTTLRYQVTNRPFMNNAIRGSMFASLPGQILWLPDWIYVSGNDGLLVRVANLIPALTGQASPQMDAQVCFMGLRSTR